MGRLWNQYIELIELESTQKAWNLFAASIVQPKIVIQAASQSPSLLSESVVAFASVAHGTMDGGGGELKRVEVVKSWAEK